MIMEWKQAAKDAKLSDKDYNSTIKRYSVLKSKAEKLYTPTQIEDMIKLI